MKDKHHKEVLRGYLKLKGNVTYHIISCKLNKKYQIFVTITMYFLLLPTLWYSLAIQALGCHVYLVSQCYRYCSTRFMNWKPLISVKHLKASFWQGTVVSQFDQAIAGQTHQILVNWEVWKYVFTFSLREQKHCTQCLASFSFPKHWCRSRCIYQAFLTTLKNSQQTIKQTHTQAIKQTHDSSSVSFGSETQRKCSLIAQENGNRGPQ